jgi:hypothetical protein
MAYLSIRFICVDVRTFMCSPLDWNRADCITNPASSQAFRTPWTQACFSSLCFYPKQADSEAIRSPE